MPTHLSSSDFCVRTQNQFQDMHHDLYRFAVRGFEAREIGIARAAWSLFGLLFFLLFFFVLICLRFFFFCFGGILLLAARVSFTERSLRVANAQGDCAAVLTVLTVLLVLVLVDRMVLDLVFVFLLCFFNGGECNDDESLLKLLELSFHVPSSFLNEATMTTGNTYYYLGCYL
eukprot:152875_1